MLHDDIDKNIIMMLKETPFTLAEKNRKNSDPELDVIFLLAFLGLGLLKQAEARGNLPFAVEMFKAAKASSLN